jgi:hypothetical protein
LNLAAHFATPALLGVHVGVRQAGAYSGRDSLEFIDVGGRIIDDSLSRHGLDIGRSNRPGNGSLPRPGHGGVNGGPGLVAVPHSHITMPPFTLRCAM